MVKQKYNHRGEPLLCTDCNIPLSKMHHYEEGANIFHEWNEDLLQWEVIRIDPREPDFVKYGCFECYAYYEPKKLEVKT